MKKRITAVLTLVLCITGAVQIAAQPGSFDPLASIRQLQRPQFVTRVLPPCPTGCTGGPCRPVVVFVAWNWTSILTERAGFTCRSNGTGILRYEAPLNVPAPIGSPCKMAVGGGFAPQYADGAVVR